VRNILIAEDEDSIREFMVINLKRAGYQVTDVADGLAALEAYDRAEEPFDIVLLDVMMPGLDGFSVCKKLRERSPSLGIIILSARGEEMDKLNGLMNGADDYITKSSASTAEITARVDALYRRVSMAAAKADADEVASGDFVLNARSRELTKRGKPVDLSKIEFEIMQLFLNNPDTALERDRILDEVWKDDIVDVKSVDVNIRRLRVKIEDDPSNPTHIVKVWGVGYKWVP